MNYPGGKNHCYHKIINLIPQHRVYIEAFLGSGAILRRKRPARINVGIEINPSVLGEVAQELPGFTVIDDVTAAPSFLQRGSMVSTTNENSEGLESIGKSGDKAGGSFLIRDDALCFLQSFPWKGDEFVYADPPYLQETRRTLFPIYEYEFNAHYDHLALLVLLKGLPCNVMISGYWSDLYREQLADWYTYEFDSMTRGGAMAREVLWMNYSEPDALHDYSFLGEDYRERERIKRKKDRWVAGLLRLNVLERRAILSAISAEFSLGQHRQS